MIFVDTGAWFALATPSDQDHARARAIVTASVEPLITSDYGVDELLTLFIAREQKPKGIQWIQEVLRRGGTRLVRVSKSDFQTSMQVY